MRAAASLSIWLVSPVSKFELEMVAKSEFGEQKVKLAVDLQGVPWGGEGRGAVCPSTSGSVKDSGASPGSLKAPLLSILLSSLCCKFRVETGIPRLTVSLRKAATAQSLASAACTVARPI